MLFLPTLLTHTLYPPGQLLRCSFDDLKLTYISANVDEPMNLPLASLISHDNPPQPKKGDAPVSVLPSKSPVVFLRSSDAAPGDDVPISLGQRLSSPIIALSLQLSIVLLALGLQLNILLEPLYFPESLRGWHGPLNPPNF